MTNLTSILVHPHITEKAAMAAEHGVYVFRVEKTATKITVAKAVKELYKVTPVKVRVVNIPRKAVIVRGRKGMQPGFKKAYIYLKKGDKIDIV